ELPSAGPPRAARRSATDSPGRRGKNTGPRENETTQRSALQRGHRCSPRSSAVGTPSAARQAGHRPRAPVTPIVVPPHVWRRGQVRRLIRRLTREVLAAATRALPRPGTTLPGHLHGPAHVGAQGEDAAVRADVVGDAGAQGEGNLLGERFEDAVLELVAAGALPREDEHDLLLEIDLPGDRVERVLAEVPGGLVLRLDDEGLVPGGVLEDALLGGHLDLHDRLLPEAIAGREAQGEEAAQRTCHGPSPSF